MAQTDLPARGHFPQVKLGKKVPKKAEALLIAAFEGEGGLELGIHTLLRRTRDQRRRSRGPRW